MLLMNPVPIFRHSSAPARATIPFIVNAPCVMHDAHLVSNGELSACGHQVTDLIVELRDSPNNRIWHFTPCNRNVRCK